MAYISNFNALTRDVWAHRHKNIFGEPSIRYKRTNHLYFTANPIIEEATIHYGWCPIDALIKYVAFYKVYGIALIGFFGLAFSILLSPIVWMDITETDAIIFSNTTTLTNATSILSPSLKLVSGWTFTLYTISCIIVTGTLLLSLNPCMLQLQWETTKYGITLTLVINGVYTIAAMTMLPQVTHCLYMLNRVMIIAAFLFWILQLLI